MELSTLIANYMNHCENVKKLSPDTLKAYRIDLRQFREYVGENWMEKEALSRFVMHLNRRFEPQSVKRKLASVRAFFSDLEFNEIVEVNPFNKLHVKIQLSPAAPQDHPGKCGPGASAKRLRWVQAGAAGDTSGHRSAGAFIQHGASCVGAMFADAGLVFVVRQ